MKIFVMRYLFTDFMFALEDSLVLSKGLIIIRFVYQG